VSSPHRYAFQLTEAELRAVILFSMLKRPGAGLRRFMAIAVGGVALAVGLERTSSMAHVFAIVIALACGWIALRPFVLSRVMAQRPAPAVEVELGEPGVTVRRDGKSATFDWSRITAQGRGPGFYWYEVQGAAIAAIPDRVIQDRAGLEAWLARAGKK
jgi:hypothetical protein